MSDLEGEVFTVRPSFWTHPDLDDTDKDKTRIYLGRSNSSPIRLSLQIQGKVCLHDPFFQVIPEVIGQIDFLFINGTPEGLQDITV